MIGVTLALVLAAGFFVTAQGQESSWTGFITDTHCGAQKDFAKHASCAKKCATGGIGKLALYTPTDKKVYALDPGDKAMDFAGKQVKVTGTLSGDTIKVSNVALVEEAKGK
jgi:hypothetical protein